MSAAIFRFRETRSYRGGGDATAEPRLLPLYDLGETAHDLIRLVICGGAFSHPTLNAYTPPACLRSFEPPVLIWHMSSIDPHDHLPQGVPITPGSSPHDAALSLISFLTAATERA